MDELRRERARAVSTIDGDFALCLCFDCRKQINLNCDNPHQLQEIYSRGHTINDGLELLDKESKTKTKVSVKQELPVPSSGKRLLQKGERSDSD